MRVPLLYLDTSVIGGYFDDEWKDATQELWSQMEAGKWRFASSDVLAQEIQGAPDFVRALFLKTFQQETLLEINDEMYSLAENYVSQKVVSPKYFDDALHVAACTISRISLLVSWNFRHLVNVQRETGFNGVNLLNGYPVIRIVNSLEIIYGSED